MPLSLKAKIKPADFLEQCRQRLENAKGGFRRTKYAVFQDTMEAAIKMMADKNALDEFVTRNSIDRQKFEKKGVRWIVLCAFAFVTDSPGQGWKAARIAAFLYYTRKIPIGRLARQMKKLGGIEELLKLAAQEDPKRSKRTEIRPTAASAKAAPPLKGKMTAGSSGKIARPRMITNVEPVDEELTSITVQVTPAQAKGIRSTSLGDEVKLICKRVESEDDWTEELLKASRVVV